MSERYKPYRDYQFFIPGKPVPQQRAKTIFRNGRVLGKYDPKQCVEYKQHVAAVAHKKWDEEPGIILAGPILIAMTFNLPKPKTAKRKSPTVKPDVDNLYKGVADALEGIAYVHDQQIVFAMIEKRYAKDNDSVGVKVTIRELPP